MSNNSIKVTLTVAPENELFARRGLQKGGRVQKYIDSEVLRCCDSYVPMLTGKLKQSGITSTVVGSGMVHYNTPYARKNSTITKVWASRGLTLGASEADYGSSV